MSLNPYAAPMSNDDNPGMTDAGGDVLAEFEQAGPISGELALLELHPDGF